ncbi:MAG: glycosyltransferase [Coriobacteriia bacterium]|nr:glycosyltransferase [Coriobacteriia bacterium]
MTRSNSILQAGTRDIGGGAEQVMMDLHAEYLRRGVDSWVAVGEKHSDSSRVLQIPNDAARSSWARALSSASGRTASSPGRLRMAVARSLLFLSEPVRYAKVLSGMEDFDFPASGDILDLPPSRPDVVHLHNLHGGYFDIRVLPALTQQVPTVLTLHDAWLIAGHCAHPFDCPRWRTGCGQCPDRDMYVPIRRDRSAVNWRTKRDAVRRSRVALSTESRWLMDMVRESGILPDGADSRVIPNGVDTAVFAPGDKAAARAELGLPSDSEIVLFIGRGLKTNPFKDYHTLLDALPVIARARGEKVLLAALGGGPPADLSSLEAVAEVVHVPFASDHGHVARYLRAADVYVHAARAENLPLAIIEAMACGTPVVASRVGGVPELVEDGSTGLLVPPGDPHALADAVTSLLADKALRSAYSEAGIARVQERFTLSLQADAYLTWYEELWLLHAGAH